MFPGLVRAQWAPEAWPSETHFRTNVLFSASNTFQRTHEWDITLTVTSNDVPDVDLHLDLGDLTYSPVTSKNDILEFGDIGDFVNTIEGTLTTNFVLDYTALFLYEPELSQLTSGIVRTIGATGVVDGTEVIVLITFTASNLIESNVNLNILGQWGWDSLEAIRERNFALNRKNNVEFNPRDAGTNNLPEANFHRVRLDPASDPEFTQLKVIKDWVDEEFIFFLNTNELFEGTYSNYMETDIQVWKDHNGDNTNTWQLAPPTNAPFWSTQSWLIDLQEFGFPVSSNVVTNASPFGWQVGETNVFISTNSLIETNLSTEYFSDDWVYFRDRGGVNPGLGSVVTGKWRFIERFPFQTGPVSNVLHDTCESCTNNFFFIPLCDYYFIKEGFGTPVTSMTFEIFYLSNSLFFTNTSTLLVHTQQFICTNVFTENDIAGFGNGVKYDPGFSVSDYGYRWIPRIFKRLVHTAPRGTYTTLDVGDIDFRQWQSNSVSTNSWAELTNGLTATPSTTFTNSFPFTDIAEWFISGEGFFQPSITNWDGKADEKRATYRIVNGVTPKISKDAEVYIYTEAPGLDDTGRKISEYFTNGLSLTENTYHLFQVDSLGTSTNVDKLSIVGTAFPPMMPITDPSPQTNKTVYRGIDSGGLDPIIIIKWDVSSGFRYIDLP